MRFLVLLLFPVLASASESFTFNPATDGSYTCSQACTGYVTGTAHTVDSIYVNYFNSQVWDGTKWLSNYKFIITVDGVIYTGYSADASSAGGFFDVEHQSRPFTLKLGVQDAGTAMVQFSEIRTCPPQNRRHPICFTHYYARSGTVILP